MTLTTFLEQFPVNEGILQASNMASELRHPFINPNGDGRYYLSEEDIKYRNQRIAANLSAILELPITRPISMDRQGKPAGEYNSLEKRL